MALKTFGALPKLLPSTVTASPTPGRITIELRCITTTLEPMTVTGTARDLEDALLQRAEAMTPVLEEILQIRPPPHWGINE